MTLEVNERSVVLSAELLQKPNNFFTHLPACELAFLALSQKLQLFLSLTAYLLLSF